MSNSKVLEIFSAFAPAPLHGLPVAEVLGAVAVAVAPGKKIRREERLHHRNAFTSSNRSLVVIIMSIRRYVKITKIGFLSMLKSDIRCFFFYINQKFEPFVEDKNEVIDLIAGSREHVYV